MQCANSNSVLIQSEHEKNLTIKSANQTTSTDDVRTDVGPIGCNRQSVKDKPERARITARKGRSGLTFNPLPGRGW